MKRLVVFDTGTGGRVFAERLRREFADVEVIEVIDAVNSPYGRKAVEEICELTEAALGDYLGTDAVILIACNTATTGAIDLLRKKYPRQNFVGLEPGIKPAVQLTRSGKIVVLATPATLRSERYLSLLDRYATTIAVLQPDCAEWARKIDEGSLSEDDVGETLRPFVADKPDVVVLGCTHYLAIPDGVFARILPGAVVFSPLPAVVRRIREILRQQ